MATAAAAAAGTPVAAGDGKVLQIEEAPAGGAVRPAKTQTHKRVPRWLRMSTRVALLVGAVALPSLVVKDDDFKGLNKYRNYNILFTTLGTVVLPIWIPHLGNVVVAFTALIPLALAALWVAYGLFLGCPSIIFMMAACVVVTALTFFTAELLSLPVGLLSFFAVIFVAGANSFVQTPPMAYMMASMLSVLLLVASVLATWACALVFPEYCVDEVFRHHHEALEHLLHLGYYTMGLRPPRLLQRVATSSAREVGRSRGWRAAFASADELPSSLQALDVGQLAPLLNREASGAASVSGSTSTPGTPAAPAGTTDTNFAVKVERSWHRVAVAFAAGAKAQVGAKAEVVVAAAHHKRIILPCVPLIPCAKGQMDEPALLALRHVGLAAALHIIKIHNATTPLDEATAGLMRQLLSAEEWSALRASLLAALQELVDVFPQDYYPAAAPPDRRHLRELQAAVTRLQAAWRKQQLRVAAAGEQPAQGVAGQQSGRQAAAQHAAVTVLPADAAAAAAQEERAAVAAAFSDPLVAEGSEAAAVLARMNASHIAKLLDDLVGLLEQLYAAAQQASEHLVSCKCC